MNTVVFNLATAGVTEYTPALTGLSGDYEAAADGVYIVDGEPLDNGAVYLSAVSFGLTLSTSGKQRRPKYLYVHGEGLGQLDATVTTSTGDTYEYPLNMLHDDVGRFVIGAGIRDNYLEVALTARGGERLLVDRMDFQTFESDMRKL